MNSPDNQYLNITISNAQDGTSPYPQNKQAIYDETLPISVLDDPSQYYCSILRFSMPLDTIPLFLFPVNVNQANPDVSNLLIGIKYLGVSYPSYVIYTPNNNIPAPVPVAVVPPYFTPTQTSSPYYFIYSVQQFLTMINTGLSVAFVASGSPGGVLPYYIYTPQTQLISLIVDAAFLVSGATIYMNAFLKTYLDSFPFIETVPGVYGNDNTFIFTHDLSILPFGGTSPYQFQEEYNALDLWFDIRKIVVTTSSIPIVPEASPIAYNISNSNGLGAYLPILTDFVVSYNNIQDITSILVYNPTAQYRLIDMNSKAPITRINLAFYWQSEIGTLFPIFLSPAQSITVKIGFLKKSLYNPLRK